MKKPLQQTYVPGLGPMQQTYVPGLGPKSTEAPDTGTPAMHRALTPAMQRALLYAIGAMEDPNPPERLPPSIRDHFLRESLRAAGGDPKRFTLVLLSWLEIGGVVEIPKGVFKFSPRPRGRPRADGSFEAWVSWQWAKADDPSITYWGFAKKFDPTGFAENPKRTVDRLTKRIASYEKYLNTL
jgi:hypothetical protein